MLASYGGDAVTDGSQVHERDARNRFTLTRAHAHMGELGKHA
jgi:hypothetical protein